MNVANAAIGEHYRVGTERGDRPEWIADPIDRWWKWTDADGTGSPGYSEVIETRDGLREVGGAWTREYVERAHWCAYWQNGRECHAHRHDLLEETP